MFTTDHHQADSSANEQVEGVRGAGTGTIRRAVAVVAIAMSALMAVPSLGGTAAAAVAHDGFFSARDGSTASVSLGCSQNAIMISVDNDGFRKLRIHLLDGSTNQWMSPTDLYRIRDTTYVWDVTKNPYGTVAMYFELQDARGRRHFEWVPFTSGRYNARTGYYCGPNGAHN